MFRFRDFYKVFTTNNGIKDYTKCARKMLPEEIKRDKQLRSPKYYKAIRRQKKNEKVI